MVNLLALKAALKAAIDAAAETERREYITAGAGQALIYAENADEAGAYLEAAAPVDEDYPLLPAEIGITGATTAEVANVINASFTTGRRSGRRSRPHASGLRRRSTQQPMQRRP
ncbi:hypothetical protein HB771_21695 [Rhizobium leguminosarum bv. viciae]|nr:hypothetical protein HB771_21695 [Rhizobium leguminosarum bv. viciae]